MACRPDRALLVFELFGQQPDIILSLARRKIHRVWLAPMQVVGKEEDLATEPVLPAD